MGADVLKSLFMTFFVEVLILVDSYSSSDVYFSNLKNLKSSQDLTSTKDYLDHNGFLETSTFIFEH